MAIESVVRGLVGVARLRVVQFLALGGLLLLVTPRPPGTRDIALSREVLSQMARAEAEKRGSLTPDAVTERAIEDELLYREGLRIGFDKSDAVVRARLVQKTLFFAEELRGAAREPGEQELRAFYAETLPTWQRPPRFRLEQVLAREESTLLQQRAALDGGPLEPRFPLLPSEAGPAPRRLALSQPELGRLFGSPFADALAKAALDTPADALPRLLGPLQSPFGFHLVELLSVDPGGPAPFEEVRDRVREVLLVKRREDAVSDFLTSAFARYRVTIDGLPVARISPARRLAFRTQESAED